MEVWNRARKKLSRVSNIVEHSARGGEIAYGETGARLSAMSRIGGTHDGRMPRRGCYPRRSTWLLRTPKRTGTETTEPSGVGGWELRKAEPGGSAGENQRHRLRRARRTTDEVAPRSAWMPEEQTYALVKIRAVSALNYRAYNASNSQ